MCTDLEFRNAYVEAMKRDLLGPGVGQASPDLEHEIITQKPESQYLAGVLYGKNQRKVVETEISKEDTNNAEEVEASEADETTCEEAGETEYDAVAGAIGDDDAESAGDKKGEMTDFEGSVSQANQMRPSSCGISFRIQGKCDKIKVKISYAKYINQSGDLARCVFDMSGVKQQIKEKIIKIAESGEYGNRLEIDNGLVKYRSPYQAISNDDIREIKNTFVGEIPENEENITQEERNGLILLRESVGDILYLLNGQANGYRREPHQEEEVILKFNEKNTASQDINGSDGTPEARVHAFRHKDNGEENVFSISVMLENILDNEPLLQPKIQVISDSNNDSGYCFKEIGTRNGLGELSESELQLELLYREKKVYASGLGTSATWEVDPQGIGYVQTDFFPTYEVPQIDPEIPANQDDSLRYLSMKYLSDLDTTTKGDKIDQLKTFVDRYASWIEEKKDEVKKLEQKLQSVAYGNIELCNEAKERMDHGIELLERNENNKAWRAFEVANRAMFMQRHHLSLNDGTADTKKIVYSQLEDNAKWRPFQLAFLLMSIPSIVEKGADNTDNSLVDLIWFPTGGGKTEAYLGLTAFSIFYRRLVNPQNDGTAVIMRYTLRLLTAQQFSRASTLICACEKVRKQSYRQTGGGRNATNTYEFGNSPISIGLWVGSGVTPNSYDGAHNDGAHTILDEMKNKGGPNKFTVLKCPWCGKDLKEKYGDNNEKYGGYYDNNRDEIIIRCCNNNCDFKIRLPIDVIDEQIYRNPPSMLISTVDKFAQLPWKGEAGVFFGYGNRNRSAPELIIQDELHLISGALGTIVGLYETAVDYLCKQKGGGTKIIASTATICNAERQCRALYNREVRQFPPPGISASDSFFAKECPVKDKPGRLYVGVMASGKTKAMTEIQLISSIMQNSKDVGEKLSASDEIMDNYWTSVAYFNNLRELGRCKSFLEQDIHSYMKRNSKTKIVEQRRYLNRSVAELTSRIPSSKVTSVLDKLESNKYPDKDPCSVAVATNMISVGLDVSRLNVMAIISQPKLTNEYIQVSSRVGRKHPGVAFIAYDPSRSRDRSHYEKFREYHQAFYKDVEPTSVTPFSEPALERALHAVFIAMMRHAHSTEVRDIINDGKDNDIFSCKTEITSRVKNVLRADNIEDERINVDSDMIEGMIDDVINTWRNLVMVNGNNTIFGSMKIESNRDRIPLLRPWSEDKGHNGIKTLTSMRNVDISVKGSIVNL